MSASSSTNSSYRDLREGPLASDAKQENRRVGAIDIGSNSIHLLIASINPVLNTFTVDLAEKSTTRLGEKDPDTDTLTESAMIRSINTLKRFQQIASSYKVEDLVMAATSAVREAPNGRDFLLKIKNDLGLDVELISGIEEARLIYLGVLSGMPFGDRPYLLIDIGGGSTELILADKEDARALSSSRLGAVRLKTDFIHDDQITKERRYFLRTFIQGSLEPAVKKILRRLQVDEKPVMVATSGTALALGMLAANDEAIPPLKLQGYRLLKEKLDELVEQLLKMSTEERGKLVALSERRAEIIVPGALILQTSMAMLSVNEVVLSERALREGLVVDWMLRQGLLKDRFSYQSTIRHRTIIHQSERFAVDNARAEWVARNALSIYDQSLTFLHNDKGPGRELLWAAAMLHSCGKHINLSSYHKHSWYLIRHGELLGYSETEHLIVAAIARYHRKTLPRKRHEAWQALPDSENRKIVHEMSLILRLASALDCRAVPEIAELEIRGAKNNLVFQLVPDNESQSLELEIWRLSSHIQLVKSLTGVDLKIIQKDKLD